MEKQELVQISAKVEEAFYEVSAKGNHNDWFPCGRAYVKVRGTTSFVKAMKKHAVKQQCDRYALGSIVMYPAYSGGFEVSCAIRGRDAYEQQSLNFELPVAEAIQGILKAKGIESTIRTWID